MAAKALLALCASALLVQTNAQFPAQCPNAPAPAAYDYAPCSASNYGNIISSNAASSNGGGLGVITSSPLSPSGISVLSENSISGNLLVSGDLPVLAAVGVEGSLPTSGSAGTTYSCGSGQVGISSNSLAASGLNAANYGASYGANNAAAAPGSCGCY